ncbi:MAG: hypothetical protein ABI333_21265 [bacterium]
MSGHDDNKRTGGMGSSPTKPSEASDWTKQEATTFAVLPQFDTASLMPKTSGRLLTALKAQIGQLKIELEGSDIRHEEGRYVVLPRTLRSAWMAKVNHPYLGEMKFLIGQTRSTWVLLYDQPHEKVYEDPRFMGVELKRRDIARTPRGKAMYVSRIERKDLDKINSIAAQDAGERTRTDTLAPIEGAFSYEEVVTQLLHCSVEQCTDSDFDNVTFVTSIQFMTPTQSDGGNFYYIEAGDEEDPMTCELHVGTDPQLPQDTYRHKATLSYKTETSFLYIDIKY